MMTGGSPISGNHHLTIKEAAVAIKKILIAFILIERCDFAVTKGRFYQKETVALNHVK